MFKNAKSPSLQWTAISFDLIGVEFFTERFLTANAPGLLSNTH